jgi:hypothetical protein
MDTVQWEYCHLLDKTVHFMGTTDIAHNAPLPVIWHDLGLEGWELVGMTAVAAMFVFKRQVQPGRAIDNVAERWP